MVKSKYILGEKNTQTTGPRPLATKLSVSLGKRKSFFLPSPFSGVGTGKDKVADRR